MNRRIITALATVSVASSMLFAQGVNENQLAYQNVNTKNSAKNIILLIGDGMSTAQIATADAYLGSLDGKIYDQLSFEAFDHQGLTTTYSGSQLITDSAAAGTAIATGSKTYNGAISVDMNKNKLKSILAYAEDAGKATGIVTTTRVTHATPAVFISNNVDRDAENEIALDESDSGVDYLAGGGYRYFVGKNNKEGLKSKRTDDLDVVEMMAQDGYTTFISEDETSDFLNYNPKKGDKVLGLFGYSHLDYAIDDANQPTLAQMTEKGIDLLSMDDDGFFMMIEAGRIDHASHANDAVTAIDDTLAFNDAVQVAIDYYNTDPENTLIIVTGDHETGGLTLGFAGTYYDSAFATLSGQTISYESYSYNQFADYKASHTVNNCSLSDLESDVENYFGLTDLNDNERASLEAALKRSVAGEVIVGNTTQDYLLYGGYEPFVMEITHILNNRAGIGWTSYSHTAVPVATFAQGPGSEQINGVFDNTDLFNFMVNVLN
ncbi:MAG: alkaline phosphatase [Sphaerochaetaceae bacterium]|nr:alkaline phosphatase [Sphaerochaetaceae bacterium]